MAAFDPSKFPTRSDVVESDFGLIVTLKYGKCNQFGLRNRAVPLISAPDSRLCPLRAYKLMCKLSPASPSSPLFTLPNCKPMTSSVFDAQLRRLLREAGQHQQGFTAHSFRRGGATAAFKAGLPGELIQSLGGWSSDCYKIYLEHDLDFKLRYAHSFSNHVHNV